MNKELRDSINRVRLEDRHKLLLERVEDIQNYYYTLGRIGRGKFWIDDTRYLDNLLIQLELQELAERLA